jgi:hypothetical protein
LSTATDAISIPIIHDANAVVVVVVVFVVVVVVVVV